MTKLDARVDGTRVVTGEVRISFPYLLTPRINDDGSEGKYTTELIIDKETGKDTIEAIQKAISTAAENAVHGVWKGKAPAMVRTTLKDADVETNKDGEILSDAREELKGCYTLNVSSIKKPGLFDQQKKPVDSEDILYPGVYARASLNFAGYSFKGKGVAGYVNAVQIVRDGERFGGADSSGEFDVLAPQEIALDF